jgi:hypothetical protein
MKDQKLWDDLKTCFVRTVDGTSWEDFIPRDAVRNVKSISHLGSGSAIRVNGPLPLIAMAFFGKDACTAEEYKYLTFRFCSELEKE